MTPKEKEVLDTVVTDLMAQLQEADLKALQDQAKITTLEVTVNQLIIERDQLKDTSEKHRELNGQLRQELKVAYLEADQLDKALREITSYTVTGDEVRRYD